MTTSTNGFLHRKEKLVVAALALAVMSLMCGPVQASRFLGSLASTSANISAPGPVNAQFPPIYDPSLSTSRNVPSRPSSVSVSHQLASSVPSASLDSSSTLVAAIKPPAGMNNESSTLPPPDSDMSMLLNGGRLLSGEHIADPKDSSQRRSSERNRALVETDSSVEKYDDQFTGAPTSSTPYVSYGGFNSPAGAPHANLKPDVLALALAPSLTPEADNLYSYQPTPQPESGDDSFMVHSTSVSAMQNNQCTYTIITSTGNIEGAGTQADVNVEFFDRFGASVLFVGLKSQNRNFNRGATDTFTILGDCLQNICRMHLSHDDAGPNPGWFVNTVTVSVQFQTHVFNVYEWLAKDEPPRSLSRTINSCPA